MQRNRMILALHAKFNHEDLTQVSHRVVWGTILPQDRNKEAQNEQLMVQSGVHSRRTAMDQMGMEVEMPVIADSIPVEFFVEIEEDILLGEVVIISE